MILFRKRTIRLVPFYLLYMAAVLAASSLYGLYAAESEEIVAQVFGDRVYCYLLVPPFIWTISTIDGSTKKPSFIRMKSRNQYLLFLLLQQYLFAVIYLTTWFSMIYILAIWHGERYLFVDTVHDQTDFTTFAQAEANKAYTSFSAYQESGNDGDYWQGVAAFYAFQEAYGLLTEDTNKSANRIFCNEVYGSLVLSPELSQAHISDILHVMKILSENVMGENGYVRMSELRNMLQS